MAWVQVYNFSAPKYPKCVFPICYINMNFIFILGLRTFKSRFFMGEGGVLCMNMCKCNQIQKDNKNVWPSVMQIHRGPKGGPKGAQGMPRGGGPDVLGRPGKKV